MSKKEYFSIGKIVGAKGLSGEIKVESWADSPEDFCNISKIFTDLKSEALDILSMKVHKSQVIMKIKSINDRNSAESLRGKILYAHREDIPLEKDRYFIEDLIGCKIIDSKTHHEYGILKNVMNTGANDIYEVKSKNGKEYLVPIIEGTVKNIDLETETIEINPIKGVFDDN